MDWDTHRYLECFFAVPMMGAVLHTVNVRLSAEQILYTINHAEDDVILINSELLPLLEQIWDRVDAGKKLVLLNDTGGKIQTVKTSLSFDAEYEALLAAADPRRDFPDLDENTRATTFYTTGTTGPPKGVYFSHRQLVLHTLSDRAGIAAIGHGWLNDGEVYMPITPMFHVHAWGVP
jgi:fatty-acyl-CoA synthase